jgi:hypothetical protein
VQNGPPLLTSSVYPSGLAFDIIRSAIVPPAPPTFSTTTGWPILADTAWPTIRPIVSAGPPAGNATMSLIGRVG